jgi:hypothetical protein
VVRKLSLLLSALFLLTVVSAFIFFANNKKIPSEINSIFSDCALEKISCVISLKDDHQVIFNLEPKGLPVMELLTLSLDGISVEGLSNTQNILKVWFEGQDMSMGMHFMLPASNHDNSFDMAPKFKGMIPVCSIDTAMVWLLNAQFKYESHFYQVQFQLQTLSSD